MYVLMYVINMIKTALLALFMHLFSLHLFVLFKFIMFHGKSNLTEHKHNSSNNR